jgi:AraC-like DNA-binding protein
MSISRHRTLQVRSYSITHPPGRVSLPTEAGWDQLVFAHAGLFTAHTPSRTWAIPAHRALCVPDGTRVRIETTRRAAIRCLYLAVDLHCLDTETHVVSLDRLLRELVEFAVARAPMALDDPADAALIALLAARLAAEPHAPLHLPLPTDDDARRVARAIYSNPALPLAAHEGTARMSRRSLERRFMAETHMSLGQWRRRARIIAAVLMLADGDTVTRAAVNVGYATPSSFVVAFRSELHATPREFMRPSR